MKPTAKKLIAKKLIAAAVSVAAVVAVSVLHVPAPVVAAVQGVITSLTQDAPPNEQAPKPD